MTTTAADHAVDVDAFDVAPFVTTLEAAAARESAELVAEIAERPGDVQRFAGVAVWALGQRYVLQDALISGGARVDEATTDRFAQALRPDVWRWSWTAGAANRSDVESAMEAASAALTSEAKGAGLHADADEIGHLPLSLLLEDAAWVQPGGRLVVRIEPLTGMAGCYTRGVTGGVILLDPEADDNTVAHELAHALDLGLNSASEAGREFFAVTLAPMLLEHQPATVIEAADLMSVVAKERKRLFGEGTNTVEAIVRRALSVALEADDEAAA